MLMLYVVPARGAPFEYRVDEENHVIGRSSRVDLVVADRSLSRKHAKLYRTGESWFIEDLGSRNGTLVNRRVIQRPTEIHVGDIIGLGASTATVQQIGDERATDGDDYESFGGHTVFRPAAELLSASGEATAEDDSAEALRRSAQRLRTLNEVHQTLGDTVELDELLEVILDRAFELLRPEEGAVFLREDDGTYACAASKSKRGSEGGLYSRALIREVAEKGLAALVLDAKTDDRFHQAVSIAEAGIRSLVAAPLTGPDKPLGMMVLGSMLSSRQFNDEDMELLVSFASIAAMRIRNLRLTEEAAERMRLEREVELAREIQVALLPDRLPEYDGYRLWGGNLPSRGVSGDFFKVIDRADGRECAFFLADVSGKGIGASLLTASLEALTAALIEQGLAPDETCGQASRLLYTRTPPEKYATGFLAYLDIASGAVRYANAGHNPGLVVRGDGSTEWLGTTGMPLGILPEGQWTAADTALGAGDLLVLYTDGITEAENRAEEEYGEKRLEESCVRHRDKPLDEFAEAVEGELEAFAEGVPFHDDRTLVIVRREEDRT